MVANHSLKQDARKLMELSPGLSLTDAKLIARATRSAAVASKNYSDRDRQVVSMAAQLMATGRDLVVFGNTASGKTTAFRSILNASALRSILLADSSEEYALAMERTAVVERAFWYRYPRQLGSLAPEIIACDELRGADSELVDALQSVAVRALVVHAPSPGAALDRLRFDAPGLSLKDPIFVEAVCNQRTPVKRLLRLHTTAEGWSSYEAEWLLSPEGYNPDRPTMRIGGNWNSPANPLLKGSLGLVSRMELWTDRDGFRTVLAKSSRQEDMVTMLRSARDTMAGRYERIASRTEEDSRPLGITVYEVDGYQVDGSGDTPELRKEVAAIADRILRLGRSVHVGILVKPSSVNAMDEAIGALRRGRDLVVLGSAGSGKTRALIAALKDAAIPKTMLLQSVAEYTAEDDFIGTAIGEEEVRRVAREQRGDFDLLGYDEIRAKDPEITELLRSARQAAVVIHANSSKSALEKLGWMGIELRDPVFLHCARSGDDVMLSYSDRAH